MIIFYIFINIQQQIDRDHHQCRASTNRRLACHRATSTNRLARSPFTFHASARNDIPNSHIARGIFTGTTVLRVFTSSNCNTIRSIIVE
jgi:hypothetical protein